MSIIIITIIIIIYSEQRCYFSMLSIGRYLCTGKATRNFSLAKDQVIKFTSAAKTKLKLVSKLVFYAQSTGTIETNTM